MKGIVKKNQIIITALAILIAVAGYLNYSEKNMKSLSGGSKEASETVSDILPETNTDEVENKTLEEDTLLTGSEDIESNDEPEDEGTLKETDIDVPDTDVPGTAVLTNIGTFSANARLQREQLRAKNKETLMNMMNSGNLSEEQKNQITNEMIHITQTAELENELETLLEAKGFAGAVVSVSDDSAEVVVNMTEIGDDKRAKIEDVVKRKTGITAANIVITPISVEN